MAKALEKICCHLECDICADRYKQPKILDCQHSFCQNCLEKYYTGRYGGEPKMPCPVCRRETVLPETSIQGLKTNFHLMGIVEEVSLQEKVACSENAKVICEICDEKNEAMHRCLDCAQNICSKCHTTHMQFSAMSNHTVATFEDIRQGKVTVKRALEEDESKCNKHKGEAMRFFCETCEELICRDCTVVDHCKPEHHYIDSGEASQKYKETLKDVFTNFEKDIEGLQQRLVASSQAKHKLAKNITTSLKAVQNRAAEIIEHVKRQEKKISDEIKQIQEVRNNVYDEHDKTVNMLLKGKQHSLQISKEVTNTASDSDFLSLCPIICKDLNSLKGQDPPQFDPTLSHLNFSPGQRIGDINLGKLEDHQVSKWEMSGEFGKEGSGPGEFDAVWSITATQPGEIAVADNRNKRVVICSTEGHHNKEIPLQKKPRAIEATPDDRLIVVDSTKYVKVFDKDNKPAFHFPTVPQSEVENTEVDLQSVAVKKDGTILVGDVKRMVWTEHKLTDGKLLDTIPVQTPPYHLAINDATDRVVVSGDRKVDIALSNGTTLNTIKPTINGEPVQVCAGVFCDDSGVYVAMSNVRLGYDGASNILLCDTGTGHVHRYSLGGTFLDCLAQGLFFPEAITFTSDGRLAVADCYSVKIYQD
ncbi:E3 ubiquitin-protein ligase TRIM71-like [Patiria miniata]|uniref:Uncharacterized protein n=1 Tax=Patiria miniata TaxID=46514 RepID=A0A913ZH30_PATMI|nr:E3 ubiquitin-protein ligase TRIM71-like [Patiria miniata]